MIERPSRHHSRRRGGVTLFFLVFIFPFMLGALSFIVDISRVIISNRALEDVSAAVALAAAHQVGEYGRIDAVAARQEAEITLAEAVRVGMVPNGVTVSSGRYDIETDRVRVEITYVVTDLSLLGFFTDIDRQVGVSVATATLCDPVNDQTPCAYPV
jgi:hypothetical protein